jgi:Uma2 family endonuclease
MEAIMATLVRSAEQPQRKVWTREEVGRLSEMFAGQRYELIDGDLINKLGQKPPHAYLISLLTTVLSQVFPGKIRVQLPIRLPDPQGITSEPEPDLVVLHRESSASEFLRRHPGPSDIALLIEVSDTTFEMDRETKGRLYARSGVEVYWIVDIPQRRVLVLEEPGDEYKSVRIYEREEQVSFGEDFSIPVASPFVGASADFSSDHGACY